MGYWRVGSMLLIASLGMNEARGQGARPMPGSLPGPPMPVGDGAARPMGGGMTGCFMTGVPANFSGCIGTMNGMIGMGGCCGGITGMPCGCLGTMFTGCTPGPCGFSPMIGMSGSCGGLTGCFSGHFSGFPGCCGGMMQPSFQQNVHQFYTAWTKTPGKSYYHRSLFVYFPAMIDKHRELLLIHYPDRRNELYFYDASQRHYLAKYHVGAKTETCFSLIAAKERRAYLKEIPNSAYGKSGPMPTLGQLGMVPSGVPENSILRKVQLRRPPSALPDEDVGLPPDEALEKK